MPSVPVIMALVAVVTPLTVAAGWAVLLRPQRGLLALAGLAPFNGLLLLVPHPGLVEGWKEGLTLATLAAAMVAPRSDGDRRAPERVLPSWVVPLGVFAGLSLLSLVALHSTQALVGAKINLFYVSVAFVAWRCPFDAADRDHLVSLLMACGFVTSVYGLVQQVLGGERLNALGYEWNSAIRTAGGNLRSFSTFDQPFPFAFFVMVVLLVCGSVALADPRRLRNRLFLWASPVLVAGMASAIVRGALLGFVVGAAWLVLRRFRFLLRIAVPVVLLALLLPGGIASALTSSSSLGERTGGWTSIATQALAAPLGVGIGATGSAAEKGSGKDGAVGAAVDGSLQDVAYQPDNYYVKTVLELGVVGLWVFVALLVTAFQAARRSAGRSTGDGAGDDRHLALGVAATVLAAAAGSFVATYWEIFPMDLYFWLFLGVITSIHGPTCDATTTSSTSRSTPSPFIPAAAACRSTSASSSAACAR